MITLENLEKNYTGFHLAIDKLTINKGEFFGLVGNNGAGKTTLFRLILDLIKPDNGIVCINGTNVSFNDDWKKHLSSFLDTESLIDFLRPLEYFEFIASVYSISGDKLEEKVNKYGNFVEFDIFKEKKFIRELSKGNQKKVGLIASLIPDSEIILWDEPFANLDPSSQIMLKEIIKGLSSFGKTIIISSHELNHVAEVCTRIVILERGKIVQDKIKNEKTLSELENYFSISKGE